MTRDEAKHILIAYRENVSEADSALDAALALAARDAELRDWLEQQQRAHAAIRGQLRSLAVPGNLKAEILARARAPHRFVWWPVAAAAALLLVLGGWWWQAQRSPAVDRTFAAFRARMVRMALREYRMDVFTDNPQQIRQYLSSKGAPAEFELPPSIEGLPRTGAGFLQWHGQPVAMVCFERESETIFLFVIDRAAVRLAPGDDPQFAPVNKLRTISWSRGGQSFVLAGEQLPDV